MSFVLVVSEHYSRLNYRNVVDDAMTSMQYAKQLALGNGLVFNAGERVEGYTNFLWVAFMAPIYALCHALHVEFVPVITHMNVLFAAANVGLTYVIGERLWGARHLSTWLALGLCAVDNSFSVWAGLGLEVHFLAFWMLLALVLARSALRFRVLFTGLALLAAHLTRPDAGLFCASLIFGEVVEGVRCVWRGDRRGARSVLIGAARMAAIWVGFYALYFAWRYAYYGALFPNTYYLKLGGEIDAWERGLRYLHGFLDVRGFVPLLAVGAVFATGDKTVRVLLVHVALHTLYVVYAGGDFFPGHRFFVPEIPEFALLVATTVAVVWRFVGRDRVASRLARHGLTAAMIAGFGAGGSLFVLGALWLRGLALGPLQIEILTWRDDLQRHRRLHEWLRENKPANASIATCLIGHTGYYSEARVIDVCGVIDPETARSQVANFGKGKAGHEKIASTPYILAKKPTYVAVHVLGGDLWRHGYYFEAGIPPNTFEGIWVRDTLLERGSLVPGTRIDFDGARPVGWTATGKAFDGWPTRGNWNGQGEIAGSWGGFVNSFHPALGNRARGTLRSAPLELEGDKLVFRVAGGNDPERLQVNLWVDGQRVHTTTGRRGDVMSRRSWDVRALRGQLAELEIVDQSSEDWGYIAVDEIAQWRQR